MAENADARAHGGELAGETLERVCPHEHHPSLPSVSRFTSVVAHDFNNALLTISGYASILVSDLAGTPASEDAHEILVAAERAAFLARLLPPKRGYPGEGEETVELQAVVSRLLPLLKRATGTSFDIEADLDPGLPLVLGDESAIERMLIRFVLDAWSGTRSGAVRFEATLNPDDAPLEAATARLGYVRLTLSAEGSAEAGPPSQSVTLGLANAGLC